MKKLQFKTSIQAPAGKVYDTMLGLTDKSTYEAWTAMFNPTSSFDGSWEKGSKILFTGVNEEGEREGMVSRIVENIPSQFVSIQHYGLVKGNEEITEGPEVDKWVNGFENYTLKENGGQTEVIIDLDVTDEFIEYMNQTYPKALEKLKEISESK